MSQKQCEDARRILDASLRAVDPAAAVRRVLRVHPAAIEIGEKRFELSGRGRVFVVGAGKGTAAMAVAVEELLGDRLTGGRVTVKYGYGNPLKIIELTEAGHPRPDEAGRQEAQKTLDFLANTEQNDLVLCLISGGGSALWPAPVEGITLADKIDTTSVLLASGATINQINCVRKHLSAIKGGLLARAAAPARVATLILSDVIDDPLDVISSGPTAPDPSTYADAWSIIEKFNLQEKLPPSVIEHLHAGTRGLREETPKPGDPIFDRVWNFIIGNNRLALDAASQKAEECGYQSLILSASMRGEAREVASALIAIAEEVSRSGQPITPPACLLVGGETTVTLSETAGRGRGKGGRNQEMALAAAVELAGNKDICFLAAGTDGTDGPTDAAGGVVDGRTILRGQQLGRDADRCLADHDAYNYFQGMPEHIKTGPTRTNVMDLYLVLIGTGCEP